MRTPCGIRIVASLHIVDGTYVYLKGETIVAISTRKQREFLALFGLSHALPDDFDTVALSRADYEALKALETPEVPFQ